MSPEWIAPFRTAKSRHHAIGGGGLAMSSKKQPLLE
jgi:hypothetical protein